MFWIALIFGIIGFVMIGIIIYYEYQADKKMKSDIIDKIRKRGPIRKKRDTK